MLVHADRGPGRRILPSHYRPRGRDDKIRIGLVHGSTFDAVDCQTNFPIAKDAAALRGFDYLAIVTAQLSRGASGGNHPWSIRVHRRPRCSVSRAGGVVAVFVSRARR